MATISDEIEEPFPIYKLAHRYLLYDVNVVSYLRKYYNICGVLMGTLPQSPQQNVFQGLPLQLMPEEARVLLEKRVAYIVDDVAAHKRGFLDNGMSGAEKKAYQSVLRRQGAGAAREASRRKAAEKLVVLRKKPDLKIENWNDIPEDMLRPLPRRSRDSKPSGSEGPLREDSSTSTEETLFDSPSATKEGDGESTTGSLSEPDPLLITPTTSAPPLIYSQPLPGTPTPNRSLSDVPTSYPLFAHLHSQGYYLAPGLRFGCQYVAYPGDPLRFHSHFLCNGMDWDQEFDLLDLVGGGRLGTGVKKGFLIGGKEEAEEKGKGDVRTFCVEWAGM